jgi:hypothetical protein
VRRCRRARLMRAQVGHHAHEERAMRRVVAHPAHTQICIPTLNHESASG